MLVVIGFNLVMLWLLEIPLASSSSLPPGHRWRSLEPKGWVSRHAHMFAVRGFAAVGALLIVKGLIGLVG